MADTANSEGTFNTLVDKIVKQIEGGIEEEPQKASSKAHLKSAISPSYFIMTINMNGPSLGEGTQEERTKLLNAILSCFPSSIIFCQELPGHLEKNVLPEGQGYKCVRNQNQAAVIWNTEEFHGSNSGLNASDKQMMKMRDEIKERGKEVSELLSRIAMVKLTPKRLNTDANTKTILAVSYHGPFKLTKPLKESLFQGLLEFLFNVKTKQHIDSFIIGGDFNFDTLKVPIPENVAVTSYKSSPRQQAPGVILHKDNFVYSRYQDLTLFWTRSILPEDDKTAYSDVNAEDHGSIQKQLGNTTYNRPGSSCSKAAKITNMLDHDPVVAVLEFPLQSKAVEDLTAKFKKVSMSEGAAAKCPEK